MGSCIPRCRLSPETYERIWRDDRARDPGHASSAFKLGSFDLAEEATQDAFATAFEPWPRSGVPGKPAHLARPPPGWPQRRHRSPPLARPSSSAARTRPAFGPSRVPATQRSHCPGAGSRSPARRRRMRSVDDDPPPVASSSPAVTPRSRRMPRLRSPSAPSAACRLTPSPAPTSSPNRPWPSVRVRAKAKIRDARIPYCLPGRD